MGMHLFAYPEHAASSTGVSSSMFFEDTICLYGSALYIDLRTDDSGCDFANCWRPTE
jgi:hypothetical protein